MKHVSSLSLFVLTSIFVVQCKTDHKAGTSSQTQSKPTVPKIQNTQDAANAIITASQAFANADCQGNATCQSVQEPAAVLASADSTQLATVLTLDNIAQTPTDAQNLSNTNSNTDINTNSNTHTNTNTGIQTSTASNGSAGMKYSGISLMGLGGAVLIWGLVAAKTGYKKTPNLMSLRQAIDIIEEAQLQKIANQLKIEKNILKFCLDAVDEGLKDVLEKNQSIDTFEKVIESLKREVPAQKTAFDYAVNNAIKKLKIANTELAKELISILDKHEITHDFANVGEAKMSAVDGYVAKNSPVRSPYNSVQVVSSHESSSKKSGKRLNSSGKIGIGAAVLGTVVAAIGGGLYANSGAGLAEGTVNDPLTVYLTTLGQIAQQLTP